MHSVVKDNADCHKLINVSQFLSKVWIDAIDNNYLIKTTYSDQCDRLPKEKFDVNRSYIAMIINSLVFKVGQEIISWDVLFYKPRFCMLDRLEREQIYKHDQSSICSVYHEQLSLLLEKVQNLPSCYKKRAFLNLEEISMLCEQIFDLINQIQIQLCCEDLSQVGHMIISYFFAIENKIDPWISYDTGTSGDIYNQYARLWFNLKIFCDFLRCGCDREEAPLWLWGIVFRVNDFVAARQDVSWKELEDYDQNGCWLKNSKVVIAGFCVINRRLKLSIKEGQLCWDFEEDDNFNSTYKKFIGLVNGGQFGPIVDIIKNKGDSNIIVDWLNAMFACANDCIRSLVPYLAQEIYKINSTNVACKIKHFLMAMVVVSQLCLLDSLKNNILNIFLGIISKINNDDQQTISWLDSQSQNFEELMQAEQVMSVVKKIVGLELNGALNDVYVEQNSIKNELEVLHAYVSGIDQGNTSYKNKSNNENDDIKILDLFTSFLCR